MRSRDKRITGEDPVGPRGKRLFLFEWNMEQPTNPQKAFRIAYEPQTLQLATADCLITQNACKSFPDEVQNELRTYPRLLQ